MATGKKGAKGNKTAHVLNLLTAPGEAAPPPAEEAAEGVPEAAPAASGRPLLPPILEVAQANDDTLAQQIQQALEEELSPPPAENSPVKEETPVVEDKPASGGKMSQDDIEKMLASMGAPADEPPTPEPEPAPAPQPASGGKMSQDDIEKMLASMGSPADEPPAPEPEPAPAPQPASGGKMSQDDIEKMLASMGAPADEPTAPEPEPAPAPQPASGGKMSQDDIEKMLASMGAPADEPPAPEPEPSPAPQPAAEEKPAAPVPPAAEAAPTPPPEDEDLAYINVMQILVEEKAPRYIKMFGLCPCKHCQADVMALTLSNLVPKYVVLPKRDRIPMLTVYEGRFNSTIFAQLTRACKVVMDHPHHNR